MQDESYCMVEESGRFHVFYYERGSRSDERIFDEEEPACVDLMNRLTGDSAIQRLMQGDARD